MHPFGDLSAYLDGALSPEASASVQAHLDTCALCRTRLAELRGTARLIAALPMPVPSRRLVPRVSVPVWIAPLRTFSTFASGAAIFLFLASAVLSSFPRAAGTSAGPAPAAGAPAANALSAPQASSGPAADSATGAPSEFKAAGPSATPAPNQVGRQEAAASDSAALATGERIQLYRDEPGLSAVRSPWLWLWLGIAFGGLSFILGRRLRST